MEQEQKKEITAEQFNEAVDTVRAYFAQEREKTVADGEEDDSHLLISMITAKCNRLVIEGKKINLIAGLSLQTLQAEGLTGVFRAVAEFGEDDSEVGLKLKAEGERLFRKV